MSRHCDVAGTPRLAMSTAHRSSGHRRRHAPLHTATRLRSHAVGRHVLCTSCVSSHARAAAAADVGNVSASSSTHPGLADAKRRLLSAVAGTERGGEARGLERGAVEEAQVAVEACGAGRELEWGLLQGLWRLQYTTARDVLPLVAPSRGPTPLKFGTVWQRFSSLEAGRVQNVIAAALPPPPLPGLGPDLELRLTLVVEAGYEARTARSIALTFREACVRDVSPAPGLQNLLASPILPRGWWNQQLLLALKQLSLSVPLTTRPPGASSASRQPAGLNYMLTYLDEDMLIGRAQGNGGSFVFTRDADDAVGSGWPADGDSGGGSGGQAAEVVEPRVQRGFEF